MFGNKSERAHHTTMEPRARGGIALGPILTGVVVAFGCMFLLSAIVAGVIAAFGLTEANVTQGEAIDAGIGAGMALVAAQFLSYLWGGYTAGRMARGSGVGNGLLVPLTALIVAALVAAIATGLGATANLNLPFTTNQLPLENNNLVDWGVGIGIASLVAMFLGGALGGGMGARWHSKLEDYAVEERATHEVDLRDDDHTTTTGSHATPVEQGADLHPQERHTTTGR